MEFNQEKLEQAIIDKVAEELVVSVDLRDRIRREVDTRITKVFAEQTDNIITERVNEAVRDGFNKEFTPVNSFGKPTGAPTTIAKLLEEFVKNYWSQKVDQYGKPTDSSYSTKMTRAQYVMAQICAQDFSKDVKDMAVDVTGQLKDGLREQLKSGVDEMVHKLFNVRTEADKAARRY